MSKTIHPNIEDEWYTLWKARENVTDALFNMDCIKELADKRADIKAVLVKADNMLTEMLKQLDKEDND